MRRLWVLMCGCANLLGIEDPHAGGSPQDARLDATGDGAMPGSDAASFMCADDSALEPNEGIGTATQTPFAQQTVFALSSLSICPPTDTDTYAIAIVAGTPNIAVTATTTAGAPVDLVLLDGAGTMIAGGMMSGSDQGTVKGTNLPNGMFFVRVTATAQSNYSLDFQVTP